MAHYIRRPPCARKETRSRRFNFDLSVAALALTARSLSKEMAYVSRAWLGSRAVSSGGYSWLRTVRSPVNHECRVQTKPGHRKEAARTSGTAITGRWMTAASTDRCTFASGHSTRQAGWPFTNDSLRTRGSAVPDPSRTFTSRVSTPESRQIGRKEGRHGMPPCCHA